MNAGSLRAAEETLTTIIDTDPAFAEAWNKRATVYFLMGAFSQSKRDIAQTIIREPRHFGALSGLGLVETHLGNYAAALKAYEQAAALHPYLKGYEGITSALKKLATGDPI
jgi:tetratricopeptide (TPR) repeat protein